MKAMSHYWWSLTVLACAAMSPIAPGATTLHVGRGDKTDPNTIQAAVDMAVAGDTIVLSPGTYSGRGNRDVDLRGKAVRIESTNPLDPNTVEGTIIDCAGSPTQPHRGFYIVDCNGAVLSGLTITHGLTLAGGAVYCQRSTLELMNCRIVDNATLPGGAEYLSGGPGGGLYCENSIVRVVGCLVSGNTTGNGAPSQDDQAGTGGNGAGICGVKSDIRVVSSTISGNTAGAGGDSGQGTAGNGGDGGGLCGDSIRLADSTVSLNVAGSGGQGARSGRGGRGGGLYADTATLDRCIIEANRAGDEGMVGADANDIRGAGAGDGGGVFGNLLEVTNGLITGNRAGRGYAADASGWVDHGNGGGLWCAAGAIRQCTIAGNALYRAMSSTSTGSPSSAGRGAGIFCTPSVTVVNSILYENVPDQLAGYDCRKILYCNVKSSLCSPDGNDVFENPAFVRSGGWVNAKDRKTAVEPNDPNAVWVQGDYRLKTTSPLLDAGDPNYVPGTGETDLGGDPRLADAAVDLGAYESQALVPVYRFWSPKTGKHFYTAGEAEKDKLVNRYANAWAFEGPVYYAYTRASEPNLLPVYRFWSDKLGGHFYTIKEAEKDKLIDKYADAWTFEGPVFYAYPEGRQPTGTKAVHRFWSDTLGSHFYTIKEAEKDKLTSQYANVWSYEGIAWYAIETLGGGPSDPNAAVYEFSGGSQEAICTLSLAAYIDGKEAKIDNPDIAYIPDNAYMSMAVDLQSMKTSLREFLLESKLLQHAATIGGDGAGSIQIPIVLSASVFFWGRAARGPFGIDPQTLTFPTTGSGSLPGSRESFTIGGSVTVEGGKLEVGLVERATQFATGGLGTLDTSALPERLSARMAGTFQWSREQQKDLLLQTTVKGSVLQLYVTSVHIQTTGVWQGKKSQ